MRGLLRQWRLQASSAKELIDLLLTRRDEIGHPDPDTAVAFVLDQLRSMIKARHQAITETPLSTRSDKAFLVEAMPWGCKTSCGPSILAVQPSENLPSYEFGARVGSRFWRPAQRRIQS